MKLRNIYIQEGEQFLSSVRQIPFEDASILKRSKRQKPNQTTQKNQTYLHEFAQLI